ncbi:hypothetical protein Sta7437_0973 [Stanieria cyanosphaera PCC 7437]|uniref:DUF4278 domain-containing protein n=1 Tax=Stanieria cyanosphaera (strain ATCC 29371 / PCC 7437) TaxID=111780 RepID=K9XPM2_STAC7|nr:hypothetical protein [Stanieria cyanosphaera]AFZ34555.1 hypothetical protein Sta7437_0973 [Stanieria cyanosphaera PCC 7437]
MELVYRGVRYNNNKSPLSIETQGKSGIGAAEARSDREIFSAQSKIATKNNFPFLRYFKQLFFPSDAKRVLNPFLFLYVYKSQLLETYWQLDERKRLEHCWYLTLALNPKIYRISDRPIQLKYRGVTYYR